MLEVNELGFVQRRKECQENLMRLYYCNACRELESGVEYWETKEGMAGMGVKWSVHRRCKVGEEKGARLERIMSEGERQGWEQVVAVCESP